MKHDFLDEFHRLLAHELQTVGFNIEIQHFPYLLSGKELVLVETKLYIKPKKGKSVSIPATLQLNEAPVTASAGEDIAVPGAIDDIDKIKAGAVTLIDGPVKLWTINAGTNALDKDAVEDILILLKYGIKIQ